MNETTYIDFYNTYKNDINKNASPLLNQDREMFFDRFCETNFPTRKTETYQNTDLSAALLLDYGLNINRLKIPVNPQELFHCEVPGIKSYLYFVINDMFYANTENSMEENQLPEGVIIGSLKTASEKYPELIKSYLSKLAKQQNDAFISFNGAFAQDGFFMYVPKNTVLDRPVQLINIMRSDVDFMANSHNLIILEENAQAKLLVCDHTIDDVHFFSNRTTEVFLGAHACYEHYKLESTHTKMTNICSLLVDQQANSNMLANIITLHNGQTRNNIHIELNGEGAETLLCGMVAGGNKQMVDNTTTVTHNKPNCHSNELFKYVLNDQSLGVFNGRLKVMPNAQKTTAFQTNRNILLTPTAKIKTKPELEIYADDVKCSHGATTGQLDENALFYMRQRGISEKEARLLLMYAFVNDVIENIRLDALKDRVKLLVEKRLRGEESVCESCRVCK